MTKEMIRQKMITIAATLVMILTFPTKTVADYRAHSCPNTTTYAPNSTFQSNLKTLLHYLSSNATRPSGFYNTSVGRTDAAHGLFLCSGDLGPQECRACVETATKEIVTLYCPVERVAIIAYDECMLRYSDKPFFGVLWTSPYVYLWNPRNISDPQNLFAKLVGASMNVLVAAAPSSNRRFATREVAFSAFQTLYTAAQCTQDISKSDCEMCLTQAVGGIPICCAGKQGGRVLFPCCYIRFETYRFYRQNISAAPNPMPATLPLPPLGFVTRPGGNGNSLRLPTTVIVAIAIPIAVVVFLIVIGCFCWRTKRRANEYNSIQTDPNGSEIVTTVEPVQYDLGTIQEATNNFSEDNKLGEGGFGSVYKGTLSDGKEIAVKRLSRSSLQGIGEFTNEVLLVAKLQHRNLTRLYGFCVEGEEKLLVYEFVANKSLNYVLFDHSSNNAQLDWSRRYKIICGIARGILYLHEDSRLTIIHRDLKPSNILLDEEMNPKISDFGTAKLCGVDQSHGDTERIVGTYGYMSPEYAFYGQFSAKSDVYSFGVLIIEIVTGKKNTRFHDTSENSTQDLLSLTWKHWKDGTPMELIDPGVGDLYLASEAMRCIHIGLLCVQEDPADRPTMATIVLMLSSYSVTLPLPKQPAFFPHTRTGGTVPQIFELESDKSSTKVFSVNDMSITETYPR